ncbi:MAG: hypothetical protein ACHQU1_12345, partial [Gemmatimonadales bacterium]
PGADASHSHFGHLMLASSGGVTLASNVFAQGQLVTSEVGGAKTITGQGHTLTVQGLNAFNMVIDNAPLIVNDGWPGLNFFSVTFQGTYASTADILTVNRGSEPTTVLMSIIFPASPPTAGHYLVANDPISANGPPLALDLTGSAPLGNGLNGVSLLGGATVIWP